jgi:hypothetical protein
MSAEWKDVHRIENDGIVVRVQRFGDFKPKYSIELGKQRDDRLMRFVPIFTDADNGRAEIAPKSKLLPGMILEALDWIKDDAQSFEDKRIERQLEGYRREDERNGTAPRRTRRTGKTARNKEKRRARQESQT